MRRVALLVFIIIPLSVGVRENPDPPEVKVALSSGESFEGEILAVRESTVVFAREFDVDEEDLRESKGLIEMAGQSDVLSVQIVGKSRVIAGTIVGGSIGFGAGEVVGCLGATTIDTKGCNVGFDDKKFYRDCLLGCGGGCLTGGLIGLAMSEKDVALISPEDRKFMKLKAHARYPNEEPEFLRGLE